MWLTHTHEPEGLKVTTVTNEEERGALQEHSPEELRDLQLSDRTVGPHSEQWRQVENPTYEKHRAMDLILDGCYSCGIG